MFAKRFDHLIAMYKEGKSTHYQNSVQLITRRQNKDFIKHSVCSSAIIAINIYKSYSAFWVVNAYILCAVKKLLDCKRAFKKKPGPNPAFPIQAVDSEAC